MPHVSGLWRVDAYFDGPPAVDHDTRVLVVSWVLGLLDEATPTDALPVTHPTLGTVYRAIVPGTDVQITYRLLSTGTPRLLDVRRL
ncbi:MAG: hypothetical protein ABIV94_08085 [Acidimicrobiales bacterium]